MYYGQLQIDKILHERYFINKKDGFFIECGAHDGITESSCYFFEKFLNWKGVNIEAHPRLFERLKSNRPNSTNINFALSDRDGTANFTHVIRDSIDIGNGSLKHTEKHLEELLRYGGHSFEKISVPTRTYRTALLEVFAEIPKVDLFVLDVEGEEINVLQDFSNLSHDQKPSIMCVEYGHIGLEQLKALMEKYGYVYDFRDEINSIFKKVKN